MKVVAVKVAAFFACSTFFKERSTTLLFDAFCDLVEFREAESSAELNPGTNAETSLAPRFQSCSLSNRFTPLCDVVEFREARDSAYTASTSNAKNAFKVGSRSC